jgi:hypothetical protein
MEDGGQGKGVGALENIFGHLKGQLYIYILCLPVDYGFIENFLCIMCIHKVNVHLLIYVD